MGGGPCHANRQVGEQAPYHNTGQGTRAVCQLIFFPPFLFFCDISRGEKLEGLDQPGIAYRAKLALPNRTELTMSSPFE